MKNKFTNAIIFSVALFSLASCASKQKAEPKLEEETTTVNVDDISPACVMAINFNQVIDWEKNENSKKTKKKPKKAKKSDSADEGRIAFTDEAVEIEILDRAENDLSAVPTTSLMPIAEDLLYDSLANLGVGIFDKDVLLNSIGYMHATDEATLKMSDMQKINGYYLLTPANRYEVAIADEISSEYFIYATFILKKAIKSGSIKNGNVYASVTTSIEISDAKGTFVKSVTSNAVSKETVPIKKSIINEEALLSIYPETIKNSIDLAIKLLN